MSTNNIANDFLSQFNENELEFFVFDSVCPGVCLDCGCEDYSVEPDARNNYCEHCGNQTVKSVLEILFETV